MIRVTAFVHLAPDADPAAVDRLVDAVRRADDELDALAIDAARTTPNSVNAGDVMLLGAFADHDAYERARRHPSVEAVVRPLIDACAARVETVRYAQGSVTVREPELRDGIHRTLLVRVEPTVDPDVVRQFEADVAAMTRHIPAIRNASLSGVDAVHGGHGPPWTHVWEQEFADLDGLTGPYMMHGYHWSFVDTWFDAQSPRRIVDPELIHAACAVRRSMLRCA
jgi:hypothetical protein